MIKECIEKLLDELRSRLLEDNDNMFVVVMNPELCKYIDKHIKWVTTNIDTNDNDEIKLQYEFGVVTNTNDRVHIYSSMKQPFEKGINVFDVPTGTNQIIYSIKP